MVLIRVLVLAMLAAAGCGQSLFDNRGDTDGGTGDGGTDGPVAATCPAPCVADAATDFDGTPTGSTGRWRYLDDRRTRTWTPMTASGLTFTGADPNNKITSCAENPTADACAALPGALLVSSAGATSAADPAIEVTVPLSNIDKLTVRIHVPTGSPAQIVRIYRNSREDVLATTTAMPGVTLDREITLDAFQGDRYLLAIAPDAMGAADVGVQIFLSGTGAVFPSKCQLGLDFASAAGTDVDNKCGADLTYNDFSMTTEPVPPTFGTGPYTELGQAADITPDHYYKGTALTPLDRIGDSTIQMWVKHDGLVDPYGAWVFSDQDLNSGGGLGAVIYDAPGGGRTLDVVTCTCTGPPCNSPTFALESGPYPADGAWHFLRITHTAGKVNICLDGRKLGDFDVPAMRLVSTFSPRLGKNVVWTPSGAFFDGSIDDVRAFTTALVCE